MNHDTEYLQQCQYLICEKLNWRPADEWRNYEFNELSEKIFDATGIQLSITTLKRIFGKVKYESLPSSATLNTLANYIGYGSWMEFKSNNVTSLSIQEEKIPTRKNAFHFNRKVIFAGFAIAILVIVSGFVFLSGKSSPSISSTESIIFKSKPLAEGLPNSVVFNFDLKGVASGNMLIQQSWDSTKTIKIHPGQTEATGIYYVPGYFRAKLIVDKKILKEHDLFIKADKWMATIDHEPVPTYLKKDELILDRNMTVSESVLKEVRTISKPTTLTYHLVKPFGGLQSNNFSVKTSLKNIYKEGPAICQTAKVFILCSKGAFIIPLSIPGCVSDINLKLNDNVLSGKSNDLSKFGVNLSDWNKIKMEVKNRHVKIYLNDILAREESYKEDAGEVVGLRFSFLGAGSVQNVKLENEKGEIVYKDDFTSR